jgi:hypothetical protein
MMRVPISSKKNLKRAFDQISDIDDEENLLSGLGDLDADDAHYADDAFDHDDDDENSHNDIIEVAAQDIDEGNDKIQSSQGRIDTLEELISNIV